MKVGNREIVHQSFFICSKDESVFIEFTVLDKLVKVEIKFENDEKTKGAKIQNRGITNGVVKISLVNWETGLSKSKLTMGVETPYPWDFLKISDRALSLVAVGEKNVKTYTIHAQFMLEESK